jgi:HlyD family secretion protein
VASANRHSLAEDLRQQETEFSTRLARHNAQVAATRQRIKAIDEEVAGIELQRAAESEKLVIIREELDDKRSLLDQGHMKRPDVNALRRAETDIKGQIGALAATIAQRKTNIAELNEQISEIFASRRETAAGEVRELQTRIADLEEQMRARANSLAHAEIRAPVDGTIVKIVENTIGGVIRPGEEIAEILPKSVGLRIEVRLTPGDIDLMYIGQTARLRLVALNARSTPEIRSKVSYVSADRLIEPSTGEAYFTAWIAPNSDADQAVLDKIYPGMPVEAQISTGERTFLEYIAKPIQDSFARAFREE